jgi:hypothetical protein
MIMIARSATRLNQPVLSQVASILASFESVAARPPLWAEIPQVDRGHAAFGELRDPVDWRSLPPDQPLRVVYLVDRMGPVLRWLLPEDSRVAAALGGIYHDHLERGDGHGEARSGWLTVSGEGVSVRP